MAVGNKIIVLGCPGSGKSVFAGKLHACTGLPLIHLDNIWWQADRTHISREEFDRRLDELLRRDQWIIDGDYSRTYEVRIRECDTIVFLDLSQEDCLRGIAGRLGTERPDLPWVETQPDPELEERVRRYRGVNRPALYTLFGQHPEKQLIVFKTRSEADAWLSEHGAEAQIGGK